ncbi:MAG: hypothetical protein RL367_2353 [Pseudomonadota bacterium]
MQGMWIAAQAFAQARMRAGLLRHRGTIERYHRRKVTRLITRTLPGLAFYDDHLPCGFQDLPIIDKQALIDHFSQFNRLGVTADQVRAALHAGQSRIGRHVIGQSTGTSGNRGYYVISDAERFVWLGTILAKTLPDALWRRHRVALALPGLSDLYQSASTGSRITLGLFDLGKGLDDWQDDLVRFAPDTIVAPPKVLRHLAETGRLSAQHIFSGAEVLDPIDRDVIEGITGHGLREIYMATEGLFGVGCQHGTLHLAEDVVKFEWHRPDPASLLVSPIVTDFTRGEMAMVRYRMNDLLQLSDAPCPCGSAYQAVARIVGRRDDCFMLAGHDGGLRMVTPDVLRNAVVDADPRVRDFRVVQTGASAISVTLATGLAGACDDAVRAKVLERLAPFTIAPPTIIIARGLTLPFDRKLRRVRRDWQAD